RLLFGLLNAPNRRGVVVAAPFSRFSSGRNARGRANSQDLAKPRCARYKASRAQRKRARANMIQLNGEARLRAIREKVQSGERLSFDDGMYLEQHADLFTLGELANVVRERKSGQFAYYNVNTHLNPNNVCVYRCTFCAFRADLKSPKGYLMSD